MPTGRGAHGLYASRDSTRLYVSNRGEGSVSVISFRTRRQVQKWRLPGGGSPDMGGVSADGRVLWLSGRYNGEVYAISTRTGRLIKRMKVGARAPRAVRVPAARALLARPHGRVPVSRTTRRRSVDSEPSLTTTVMRADTVRSARNAAAAARRAFRGIRTASVWVPRGGSGSERGFRG